MGGACRDPEYIGGKLRIDLGELGGDHRPQDPQGFGRGGGGRRHLRRSIEVEGGVLDHLGDGMPRMHAGETEAPARAVESEQAAVGDERNRAARAIDVVRARSRRADEVDLFH